MLFFQLHTLVCVCVCVSFTTTGRLLYRSFSRRFVIKCLDYLDPTAIARAHVFAFFYPPLAADPEVLQLAKISLEIISSQGRLGANFDELHPISLSLCDSSVANPGSGYQRDRGQQPYSGVWIHQHPDSRWQRNTCQSNQSTPV